MANEDDDPVVRGVIASYSWFTHKTCDLVITRNSFLLIEVPTANRPNWPEKMHSQPINRVTDADKLAAQVGTIAIPYSTVRNLRFYVPPVQPNMRYDKLGLGISHNLEGEKPKKLRVAIDANLYIKQRLLVEGMSEGQSQWIRRWNELLSEYAAVIRELLVKRLPSSVTMESR
mgnify:CR=1 FL=1